MGQNLSIDAPNFFITHYGKASKIDIVDIGSGLYIEKGYIQSSFTARNGNVRLEKQLSKVFVYLSGDVSISIENNVHIDWFSCGNNSSIPFSLSLSGEGDIRHIETGISMVIGVDVEEIDVISSTGRNIETFSQAHIGTIKASDSGFSSENKLRIVVNEGSKVDEISTQRSDWSDWLVVESSQHVHVWGPGTVTKEPTCIEDGIESYVCTCGQITDSKVLKAFGHDFEHHEAKDPTCTEDGYDAYDTCKRCAYSTYEKRSKLGHDIIEHAAVEPTCTEKGCKAFISCSRCDYTTYEELSQKGHSIRHYEKVDQTCTEKGNVEYWRCNNCNKNFADEGCRTELVSIIVDELGHDLTSHDRKDPTCLDNGWNKYETCSRCDYSTYEEIPALGHDIINVASKESTCTDIGWNAYEHCSRCSYSTYKEIPAKGHSFSSEWSMDSLYHWHASTCGHTELTQGKGEHSWNVDNICEICGTKNEGSSGIEIEQPEYEVSIDFPAEWGGSLVIVPNVSATLRAVLEPSRDDARYEFIVDGNRIGATSDTLVLGIGAGKVQLETGMHVITVIVAFDGTTYSQHYRIESNPSGCGTADSVSEEATI